MEWSGFSPPGQAALKESPWNFRGKKRRNPVSPFLLLFQFCWLVLFCVILRVILYPKNGVFLILSGFLFLPLKMLESLINKGFPQYLQGFLKSGAEGNRTPVRKPIPCSSTIIVGYLTFPLPHGNRHSCGFSSFIIRPYTQSLMYVVSHIVDARFLMCECTKADSSH